MDKSAPKKSKWDNKLLLVSVSIIASILLWVFVTASEGDKISETFNGIPVIFDGQETLRERDNYVLTEISANTVSVTLSGTRPNISALSADMLTAVVDLSNVSTTGPHTYTYTVGFPMGVSASDFEVEALSPQNISFVVDRTNSKTVEIKGEFNGSVAEGYANKPLTFDSQTITIGGPEDELALVDHAWVEINSEDVDKTISFESDYVLMDAEGNEIPLGNLVPERDTVTVTLTIIQQKEVPLTFELTEGAGATTKNTTVKCDPMNITISGDPEILDAINSIPIATIDLNTFETTFENTFPIVLPDGVTNVTGETEVKVTLEIIGLDTRTINVTNISYVNLTEGFNCEIVTTSLVVTLRGEAEVLKKIESTNVRVVIDMAEQGTATGTYELIARVFVDGFTDVGAVAGPYKVYVDIS